MKKFNNVSTVAALCLVRSVLMFSLLLMALATPVLAHRNPVTCSGSGLGINLFTASPQVHIGDVISYDAEVYNGTVGPIVCDADNITASIITPDGVTHPITLTRTALSNGQLDSYPAVVLYTVRAQDVQAGILAATASDTGTVHQNNTDSTGGGFQGLNITVIVPGTLNVIKTVVNDNAGTTSASGFNLHVKRSGTDVAGSPAVGAASPGTSYVLDPGTYLVSEDVNILYSQTFSGDCNSSGSVTLLAGENKTCTITNNDVPPASATINVVKVVVNDNNGTKTIADFPLFVNGSLVVSGVTNIFPAGAYIVTETTDSNYSSAFSGDCDASGNLSLIAGENKICTITNNDIPPVPPPGGGGGGGGWTPPPVPPPIIPPPLIVVPPPVTIVPPPIVLTAVSVPTFPKTGFFSDHESVLWNNLLLLGYGVIIAVAFAVIFKKREI